MVLVYRADHRMGRARVAKVEVVEGVTRVGFYPRLVVGRRASPLGLAVGDGYLIVCSNAAFSAGGNALPLRSALLNIPAHAVGLKKNLCGSTPVSKTRDNEDSTATLGDSEVLSVQHSVSEPIPEFCQRPEE